MAPDLSRDSALSAGQVTARRHLTKIGAGQLPSHPWMVGTAPHSDATLIRYALWRADTAEGLDVPRDLFAALTLLESARAELDALEAGLLFASRAEGLTWPQIADHLGVRSPQAAQQRFERVTSRTEPSRRTLPEQTHEVAVVEPDQVGAVELRPG